MNILYNHKTEKSFTERYLIPFLVIVIIIAFSFLFFMIIFSEIGETTIQKILLASFFGMMTTLLLMGLLLIDNFILFDSAFTPSYRLLSIIKRNKKLEYCNIVELVKNEVWIRIRMSDGNLYLYGFEKINDNDKISSSNREKVWNIFRNRCNDDCKIINKLKLG